MSGSHTHMHTLTYIAEQCNCWTVQAIRPFNHKGLHQLQNCSVTNDLHGWNILNCALSTNCTVLLHVSLNQKVSTLKLFVETSLQVSAVLKVLHGCRLPVYHVPQIQLENRSMPCFSGMSEAIATQLAWKNAFVARGRHASSITELHWPKIFGRLLSNISTTMRLSLSVAGTKLKEAHFI